MTIHHPNALIPIAAAALPAGLLALDIGRASDFAQAEKADATKRAYGSDFALFRGWCAGWGVSALPATPESVAAFLACEAEKGIRPSTIGRRGAAIKYAHKLAGHAVPTDDEAIWISSRAQCAACSGTIHLPVPSTPNSGRPYMSTTAHRARRSETEPTQ